MSHLSEWMRFFDDRAGQFRLKHKGSGVVRDTLWGESRHTPTRKGAVGNVFKKSLEKMVEKGRGGE